MKINCREFKHPISIQRYMIEKNKDELPIEKWREILGCKAKIVNKSGKEVDVADGKAVSVTTRFYIRFSRGINLTEKDRVIYDNKIYNIIYASNIQEANEYYEIVGVYNA